ncbi:MAG: FoF1 ATP synthase subunit gamma [Isosphaeraceae bacterium]
MTWEATHRRKQAVDTVHYVVSAMRAIAAGRIPGAQRALASARRYDEIVMRAMGALLDDSASFADRVDHRPTTLLVMTSEQPLCGSFNPNVLGFAEHRWQALSEVKNSHLVVVGQRGIHQLMARGIAVSAGEPAATSLEGLHDLVERLADLLGRRHSTGDLGSLRVVYNRYQSLSEQVPTEVQVLPMDLEQIRRSASARRSEFLHDLTPAEMLSGLVQEYLFISLYLVAVESFASEQASRLVAMDASSRNTERMLETLRDLERRERQGEIPAEVLELIGAQFAAGS